jgi:hypothetical protein
MASLCCHFSSLTASRLARVDRFILNGTRSWTLNKRGGQGGEVEWASAPHDMRSDYLQAIELDYVGLRSWEKIWGSLYLHGRERPPKCLA